MNKTKLSKNKINKSKYSRNRKITKRKRTIKYRQYGGDPSDKVESCNTLITEIEKAQGVLTKNLMSLVSARGDMAKDPHSINNDKVAELEEHYKKSADAVDEKVGEFSKVIEEIHQDLINKIQARTGNKPSAGDDKNDIVVDKPLEDDNHSTEVHVSHGGYNFNY